MAAHRALLEDEAAYQIGRTACRIHRLTMGQATRQLKPRSGRTLSR
jgi:hypothetical protein